MTDNRLLCVVNFQHHKRLKELNIGDLIVDSGNQEDDDPNMSINLLTVAGTGNAAFLDELLKARLDPDIGDSKGRTPLVKYLHLLVYSYNYKHNP